MIVIRVFFYVLAGAFFLVGCAALTSPFSSDSEAATSLTFALLLYIAARVSFGTPTDAAENPAPTPTPAYQPPDPSHIPPLAAPKTTAPTPTPKERPMPDKEFKPHPAFAEFLEKNNQRTLQMCVGISAVVAGLVGFTAGLIGAAMVQPSRTAHIEADTVTANEFKLVSRSNGEPIGALTQENDVGYLMLPVPGFVHGLYLTPMQVRVTDPRSEGKIDIGFTDQGVTQIDMTGDHGQELNLGLYAGKSNLYMIRPDDEHAFNLSAGPDGDSWVAFMDRESRTILQLSAHDYGELGIGTDIIVFNPNENGKIAHEISYKFPASDL